MFQSPRISVSNQWIKKKKIIQEGWRGIKKKILLLFHYRAVMDGIIIFRITSTIAIQVDINKREVHRASPSISQVSFA